MHEWDEKADLLAHSVLGYAVERLRLDKDTRWGARAAGELAAELDGVVCASGIGGHEALRLFRDVLMPACRPMDDPRNLAYVPTAPTIAANLFDLVVSASSIFGGCGSAAPAPSPPRTRPSAGWPISPASRERGRHVVSGGQRPTSAHS